MKVFVIGASGRVGRELVKDLAAAGRYVSAGTRHVDQDFGPDVQTVAFDLHGSVEEMSLAMKGNDAVYFVAGSRGADLLQTDAFGVVKTSQAAEAAGIKRYLLLSSLFATEPSKWHIGELNSLSDYNVAKFFGDHWLMDNTHLNYTILQPGTLKDEPGTGHVALGVTDGGVNPIPDVAATLVALLDADNTVKKIVTMHTGDTPIEAAVAGV